MEVGRQESRDWREAPFGRNAAALFLACAAVTRGAGRGRSLVDQVELLVRKFLVKLLQNPVFIEAGAFAARDEIVDSEIVAGAMMRWLGCENR